MLGRQLDFEKKNVNILVNDYTIVHVKCNRLTDIQGLTEEKKGFSLLDASNFLSIFSGWFSLRTDMESESQSEAQSDMI